jgi:hypothetical protein
MPQIAQVETQIAIIAISLVLLSVFVPITSSSGISGTVLPFRRGDHRFAAKCPSDDQWLQGTSTL